MPDTCYSIMNMDRHGPCLQVVHGIQGNTNNHYRDREKLYQPQYIISVMKEINVGLS